MQEGDAVTEGAWAKAEGSMMKNGPRKLRTRLLRASMDICATSEFKLAPPVKSVNTTTSARRLCLTARYASALR